MGAISSVCSRESYLPINHSRKVYPAPRAELEDCPICLEALNNSVYATKCGHYFHSHCMHGHDFTCKRADRDTLCPLCRRNLRIRKGRKKRHR
jgi:hypothetical protein